MLWLDFLYFDWHVTLREDNEHVMSAGFRFCVKAAATQRYCRANIRGKLGYCVCRPRCAAAQKLSCHMHAKRLCSK